MKLETIGDLNFSRMIKIMMADTTFPWFDSVHTLKIYQIRYLKDLPLLKKFLTRFRGLKTLKGITEEEFNPLDGFIQEGKRVPSLSWTMPEQEALRKQVFDFLQFN